MATEVLIPKLGMTMTEGTVAEWLVPDGKEVQAGELIYRLETEKIEMEIEAEGAGVVRHVAEQGATLPCGSVVAVILGAGEAMPAGAAGAPPVPVEAAAASGAVAVTQVAAGAAPSGVEVLASPAAKRVARERGIDIALITGTGPGGRVTEEDVANYTPAAAGSAAANGPASPLARKLAEQLGVDLATVKGTGPGGRVTKEDVEAAAAQAAALTPARAPQAPPPLPSAVPAVGEVVPIKGIRKVIFQRMHQSIQEMAQLTLAMEVWMDDAVKLRTQLVAEWASDGVKPSFTDLVIKAVARALRKHPGVNAQVVAGGIQVLREVHVGMAVAVDDGLVVPVIRDADVLSLKQIAAESSRLATGARTGKLGPDDYAGGTFSVTALGMFGVDMFTPIINPPNVGILGVGRIHDGTAWEGDRPVKRQQMTLSLTWDHRVVDGAPAAEFVQTVKGLLEAPYRLLV